MPVGEAVHRDDRLDEVVLAAEVVGGAQRAGAAHITEQRRLTGRELIPAGGQPVVGALSAAGDGDLGGGVAVWGAVGVEQRRCRVSREHTPSFDEPVGAERAQAQVGRLVAHQAVHVREEPFEPRPAQPAPGRESGGVRE